MLDVLSSAMTITYLFSSGKCALPGITSASVEPQ